METIYFVIPGLGNSDENHWQTLWERQHSNFKRIEQVEWFSPVSSDWIRLIELAIADVVDKKIILVAHSLGCLAVAQWSQQTQLKIDGALLVAPPDVNLLRNMENVHGFEELPHRKLPFKSILIASSNDEYAGIETSEYYAQVWGSEFVNVGEKGHVNAKSNIGDWGEGFRFLSLIA